MSAAASRENRHSYIVLKPDWYYEKCYKYVANPEIDSQPRSLEISDPVRRTNALDLYIVFKMEKCQYEA